MGKIEDPGAPGYDVLARNVARNAIRDMLTDGDCPSVPHGAEGAADYIAGAFTYVWERGVNDAGVPVRRYVARSAWEVDPNPPSPPNDLYTLLAVPRGGEGELP